MKSFILTEALFDNELAELGGSLQTFFGGAGNEHSENVGGLDRIIDCITKV